MKQVARNLTDIWDGLLLGKRYLIHDRTRYSPRWYVDIVPIPTRSPNCNPHAERFVRSIKEECLNRMVLFGRNALERALREISSPLSA